MESNAVLDTLATLAGTVEQLNGFTRDGAEIQEIGDGNLNFVYRAKWILDGRPCSVVVKQAPAYIKCLGPKYALTQARLQVEYHALQRFHEIMPGSCPRPYYFDQERSLMIMEDLGSYVVMRSQIISGIVNVDAACAVAKFAAAIHSKSHKLSTGSRDWEDLCDNFSNADMVDITRQYVFVRPYDAEDPTNKSPDVVKALSQEMRSSAAVKRNVADLTRKFLENRECLLHGDLHSGSIMVCGSEARLFDVEFACIGPAAFEIGMYTIQFCVSWLAHKHCNPDVDGSLLATLEEATRRVWDTYRSRFFADGVAEDAISQFWLDAVGFGACEATRRVIGAAPIPDLSNDASLLAVLRLCYKILSDTQSVNTVDRLIEMMKSLA
ncbi:methylthioribose kinase-like [Sycon ciliatum]|uniref:methylthioribose kinase-like n=1 Tax=Sycon ciliatum TaxID=27933 RepID=UPI0031F67EC1|eukprot:scpid63726/ scgid6328/ Methylthioribose kinase